MALISKYNEARERWTWKRQVMDDDRTKILSDLRIQGTDQCAYFALVTTLEPNVKVQLKRSVTFSIPHLKNLDEVSRTSLPTEVGKIKRLLLMVRDVGICEEGQYRNVLEGILEEAAARKYRIEKFYHYEMDRSDHIKHALYQLRDGGPLVAVIGISDNYDECRNSGVIYRFDPNGIVRSRHGVPETHALCVVSFAVEGKVPCLECQDSRGSHFGRDGFLMVDITSVIELYSIRIRRLVTSNMHCLDYSSCCNMILCQAHLRAAGSVALCLSFSVWITKGLLTLNGCKAKFKHEFTMHKRTTFHI